MSSTRIEPMPTVDEIIAWDVPSKCRSLTREEIIRDYGAAAVRPLPVKAAPFAPEPLSRFVVHRVFDDGRKEVVSGHRTHEDATKAADRARDGMSDTECGGDFTYLPGRRDA